MTDHDYQLEQGLRAQTREKGAGEVALVLADFYEERGQPSRAMLWRRSTRVHAQRRAADLICQDPRWRRKVMMWLLGHVTSQTKVARAFKSSDSWARVLIREVELKICEAANVERHHPTMTATLRLQAAGALPKPFERGAFELGEVPPESWPARRQGVRYQ
jgi:hypothetical protein